MQCDLSLSLSESVVSHRIASQRKGKERGVAPEITFLLARSPGFASKPGIACTPVSLLCSTPTNISLYHTPRTLRIILNMLILSPDANTVRVDNEGSVSANAVELGSMLVKESLPRDKRKMVREASVINKKLAGMGDAQCGQGGRIKSRRHTFAIGKTSQQSIAADVKGMREVGVRQQRLFKVLRECYAFLSNFCTFYHEENQAALFGHLDLFIAQAGLGLGVGGLIDEMFKGNSSLTSRVTPGQINAIVGLFARAAEDKDVYFSILRSFAQADEDLEKSKARRVNKRNQDIILECIKQLHISQTLHTVRERVTEDDGGAPRKGSKAAEEELVADAVRLLRLMNLCCNGKNEDGKRGGSHPIVRARRSVAAGGRACCCRILWLCDAMRCNAMRPLYLYLSIYLSIYLSRCHSLALQCDAKGGGGGENNRDSQEQIH